MSSVLDRKLIRDLVRLRGQAITIALVVTCGIGAFVATLSTYRSLTVARDTFYRSQRFADVWSRLERAPLNVASRLQSIDGVAQVVTRIEGAARLPMAGLHNPAMGHVQSLPDPGDAALDTVQVLAGRLPRPDRDTETLVIESFAKAHHLRPGDTLTAVIEGRLRRLRVVGIATSPDWVLAASEGAMAVDHKRFGILFMPREALSTLFGLRGSFNRVALSLEPNASAAAVIAETDRILEPFGGLGAYGRDRQPSHYTLTQELEGLRNMATTVPPIFLMVAAFLLNVVLSRLVQLQRGQIAALKALGYFGRDIGTHYLKLVGLIVGAGVLGGLLLGRWLGVGLTAMYAEYFRFPTLVYRTDVSVTLAAIAMTTGAGFGGAIWTVRGILSLPPAEAMRPPAPADYRRTILEGLTHLLALWQILATPGRIVVRELGRRPIRLAMSVAGIASGIGILVVGLFFGDAMSYIVDAHFQNALRWDLQAAMTSPVPARTVRSLATLNGVRAAEGYRSVPVRVQAGHRYRDVGLQAFPETASLQQVLTMDGKPVAIPSDGVLITDVLARRLDVEPGQSVGLQVKEGNRASVTATIRGVVAEPIGLNIYTTQGFLDRTLGEEPAVTAIALVIDPLHSASVLRQLERLPALASVAELEEIIGQFREQSAANLRVFTMVFVLATAAIVIGVVYNNARVTLSTRQRDLGTLRVLGLTQREISIVLLGELAVHVALAIPLGLAFGYAMSTGIAQGIDPEMYRLPVRISSRSYAFAAVVAIGAAAISGLLVRHRIRRLDLIGVLKTRT